jgi:hypothetical protein
MSTDLVPTKDALEADSRSWADKARGLAVTDKQSCENASYLLRSVKTLRGQVQAWFAPHLSAAMETKRKAEAARKGLADEQARIEQPLMDAEAVLKRSLLDYEAKEERARLAEEQRLQAEANRRAEEITLAAAAALELEANGNAEMLAEAADILEQPIEAPVVSVAKQTAKVQGVTYRDNWKAHPTVNVRDLAAAVAAGKVPENFLTVNMTAINQFARATQGAQPVAGVRFFNDRQIAARG